MIQIRAAQIGDISVITDIYNDAIANTTATFDTEIKTQEERKDWLQNRTKDFPVIVAIKNNEVVGYAAINHWSPKKGYDLCGEVSFYVKPQFRNQGIGKELLGHLVLLSSNTKLQTIISRITQGNDSSIHLHKINNFDVVGILKKCGNKFGKVIDVTIMQKVLIE
jgi:phosphinothricin acetyltransferase